MTSFVVILAACSGGGGKLIQDLTVEPGAVPGTAHVRWTSSEDGVGVVNYGKDGVLSESRTSESGTDHDVLLLTPQVGQTYTVQVEFESDSGKTATSDEVEVDIDPPGQGTPQFSVATWEPSLSCMDGGYVLFSWLGDGASGVGILDREGKYVWARQNDVDGTLIARTRPGRDGRSLLWNYADANRDEDVAKIVRMSMDGETVTETRTVWGHHDFVELPDGRLSWLGYDFRDLDLVDDDPDMGVIPVATDTILIDDEGVSDTSSATQVFNFFDDVSTDIYDIRDRPNTDTDFLPGYYEYTHSNSLVYNESDDSLLIMFRWLDTLQKLDTTGARIWQFGTLPGGLAGDFTGNDADRFVHAHFSEAWGDQLLIFDNHDNENDDPPSMLKQFTMDESAMTFEKTWQLDSDRLENLLGDVRRMPIDGCDNVLVSWSAQGRIVELTRDGTVAWELKALVGAVSSRVHFIPDLHDFSDVAYPQ